MYLITKKQKLLSEVEETNMPLVAFSFVSDCSLTNEELTNEILSFLKTKEVSYLQLEKENGLKGLTKKDSLNVSVVFNDDSQEIHSSFFKNPYRLVITIFNLNMHQVQVEIQTTALYYDTYSLLECAEKLQNIILGKSNLQEEQISYLQYLGWKQNLLLEADDEALTYWEQVSKSLEEQTYNWVISTPKLAERTSYGKQNSCQKNQLSAHETSDISAKDIMRYLWVNLIASYSNTEELFFFERISSRVFQQLEATFGAIDEFVPISMLVSQEKDSNEAILQCKENLEKAVKYGNYYTSESNQKIPKRTAAFDYVSTFIDEVAAFSFERISESAIALHVVEQEDTMSWRIAYDEASFNKKWIQEIEATLTRSIKNFCKGNVNSHKALIALKEVNTVAPQESCSHLWQLFSNQVKQKPDAIAIRTSKEVLSYQEFHQLINRLSAVLYEAGINEHKKVVIDVHRSLETIVILFAILRNRATFIPVDFKQGDSRIKMILEDVKPDAIISHANEKVVGYNCILASLLFAKTPNLKEAEFTSQDHIAYILYTSGSTGTPKGCPIKISSLTNYLLWSSDTYFAAPNNGHFSWFTPLTFDLTITSIFLPFVRGNSLSILDNALDTSECLQTYLLENTHCDTIKLTPAHITLVDNLDCTANQFKTVIIGGDILRPKHVKILKERFKDAKYYNEYGPTEATIGCVVKEITSPNTISVGKPISHMVAEVMDDLGNSLPYGIIGEVYLNGVGLIDGYWNREDLNNKAFTTDAHGNRFYKTGDLGYKTLKGDLQIVGRKDSQIKIRGFRVELNEIISFIEKNDEVTACELLSIGEEDARSLVAFIVAKNNSISTLIKEKVTSHFPSYMVPSNFIVLDRIPMNKNGKADRKKLYEHYKYLKKKRVELPENEQEAIILELWQSIFDGRKISVTSDFFEEGGHSLNATKLVSLLRKKCQVAFTLKDIYKATSIREQAALVGEKRISKTLEKAPDTPYYELTPTQKIFWISEQKSHASVQYTMPVAYKLQGKLAIEALKKAFEYCITKHEVFSTVVVEKNGQPLATHSAIELPWVYRKITTNKELQDAVVYNNLATFNASQGPLFRIELLKKEQDCYYLLLNFHHLIFDGWSEKVFFNDVQYSYSFYEKGQEPKLVPLEWKPKDFSYWINKKQETEAYKKQLDFWAKKLEKYSSNTSFPPYQDTETAISDAGTSISFKINDKSVLEKLEGVSKQLGVTPFSVWLGALKVLLYQYTGEQKWIVGIPFANRAIAELKDQIGCYLNMLPVPSEVQENHSWKEQIKQEHQHIKDVIANSDCSYQDILALNSQLQPSGKPLYDVMLTWLEDEIESNTLSGIALEKLDTKKLETKLNLVMSVRKKKEEIVIEYDFKNDVFTEKFISEFHRNMVNTLTNCLENTNQHIATHQIVEEDTTAISAASEIVKSTFVTEWNNSLAKYANRLCVIDAKKYSYQDIDVWSNQYANTILGASKVNENPIIAVEGFSGANLIAAILGILKTGAIYLPIDASWPEDRKSYVLEHSKCRYIITNEEWEFPSEVSKINQNKVVEAKNTFELPTEIAPQQWAYVLFTSGSTGRPKGVQIQHDAFINMIKAQIDVFSINLDDVVMPMASVAFDASLSEYFMALFSGGALCFPSREEKKNPKLLQQRIEENKVTTITLTPSMLKVFIDSIRSIDKLICAGEALFATAIEALPKDLKIFNAYGPTECAVCASIYELDRTEVGAIPIGKPINNLKLKVMLSNRVEAPNGIKGTLCVGGWPVSSSYLNNKEANEEKYFTIEENGVPIRYYNTGDLVVQDENLVYLGRLDHQVQISGRRVELNEISVQLRALDGVEDTIIHYSKEQGHFLIAWLITSVAITAEAIRKELEAILPEYMVPTDIIFLDNIPLNSSGKSDVKKLLNAFLKEKNTTTQGKNSNHKKMIAVWREILVTENIYDTTDFFKAGGNSLKAIQLIARIQEEFGVSLSIKSIYEHSLLEDFATYVSNSNATNDSPALAKDVYVANPAQKRFWILNSMNKNSRMLHMPLTFLITGTIDKDIFVSSINDVLSRHEVYKSKFEFKDGELFVRFKGLEPTCITTSSSPKNQEVLCEHLLDVSFNLEKGELIKVMFEKTISGDYFLGINIHHILADNWTVHLLLVELFEQYNTKTFNVPEDKKTVVQYAEFLEDFEVYQNSNQYKSAEKYWSTLLSGINGNGMQSLEAISNEVATKNEMQKLWDASNFSIANFIALGYSTYQYWISLVSLTNYALSGQNELAMVSPVAARTASKYAQTHGLFMNMNPVCTKLDGNMKLSDFLARLKQDTTQAKKFQEYPYTEMLKQKSILENKSLSEFIQVELQVNEIDDLNKAIVLPDGVTVTPIAKGNDFLSRKYELEIHFNKRDNEWEFYLLWDDKKYNESKIQEFSRALVLMADCFKEIEKGTIAEVVSKFKEKQAKEISAQQKEQKRKLANSFLNTKI